MVGGSRGVITSPGGREGSRLVGRRSLTSQINVQEVPVQDRVDGVCQRWLSVGQRREAGPAWLQISFALLLTFTSCDQLSNSSSSFLPPLLAGSAARRSLCPVGQDSHPAVPSTSPDRAESEMSERMSSARDEPRASGGRSSRASFLADKVAKKLLVIRKTLSKVLLVDVHQAIELSASLQHGREVSIRRASFRGGGGGSSSRIAPDYSPGTPPPDDELHTSSTSPTLSPSLHVHNDQLFRLALTETDAPLYRLAVVNIAEGAICAVSSALFLYPIHLLLVRFQTALHIDLDFLYSVSACFCAEVMFAILFRKSKVYLDRHYFCMWPTFFVLVIVIVLATGGKTGVASIPLAFLVLAITMSSSYFYERLKGIETSVKREFGSGFLIAFVVLVAMLAPTFAVFLPVFLLRVGHPTWNIFVSGVAFPSFTFVLRKLLLGFGLDQIKQRIERGEMHVNQAMSFYVIESKMVSTAITLANIASLYFSKTMTGCVTAASLSIATEVLGKMYVALSTREGVDAYRVAAAAKRRIMDFRTTGKEEGGGKTAAGEGEAAAAAAAAAETTTTTMTTTTTTTTTTAEKGKDWDFIMGMLAARWESDNVAEKSAILFAAFLIWLFKLSDMHTVELLQICAIFFVGETLTDVIVVFVLSKYFRVPFLRLPAKALEDVVIETMAVSFMSTGIALLFSVAFNVLAENL